MRMSASLYAGGPAKIVVDQTWCCDSCLRQIQDHRETVFSNKERMKRERESRVIW